MTDTEIAAMDTAYQALRCIPPGQWERALNYLADRLSSDDRTAYIAAQFDRPAPMQFIHEGEMDAPPYASADELVRDCAEAWQVIEVNGVAVVSQRFAVMFPISSNGEDIDGHEIEWFDSRDAANAFVNDERRAPVGE